MSPHLILLFTVMSMTDVMSKNLIKLKGKKRDLFEVLARLWYGQKRVNRGNCLSGVERLCFSWTWPLGMRMSPWETTHSEKKVNIYCI